MCVSVRVCPDEWGMCRYQQKLCCVSWSEVWPITLALVCWLCSCKTNSSKLNVIREERGKKGGKWTVKSTQMMVDISISAQGGLVCIYRCKQAQPVSEKHIKTSMSEQELMAPNVSRPPHSLRVIPWQKCVTSTCFDGIVYWAEDGNGVGYIYTHMPGTQHSA